jgi:predicted metalloprotease with PDZ domain
MIAAALLCCTALLGPLSAVAQVTQAAGPEPEPVVYTIRVPSPETQIATIEASLPTEGRAVIEVMMPIWSPGFYRIEDYAAQVRTVSARATDGDALEVERTRANRWRIATGGASRVFVSYELTCEGRSVTTNWVSPELGVLNGPATFIRLADGSGRPHEVRLELPPAWKGAATGLTAAPDGEPHHYRADDYDTLVDAPIIAGDLSTHEFVVDGVPHYLVDVGPRGAWDGARAARDLQRIVEQSLPLWGRLPYERYVFLNVFRRGGGGLEHANSTLLTANAERLATESGYRRWLSFVAHEYFHAFNVERLRPVELGPFDYEEGPRTASLWQAEGVTSYYAELFLARSGLGDASDLLAALSATIRRLQNSPGRLLETLEGSSLNVWTNSLSGVGAAESTVSYYVKGMVVGFLLDARIRHATGGRKSLDDVMRLAYERYGGARGFTPDEFRATAEEVAGVDLREWFHRALATTEELDYSEVLDWYGLGFAPDGSWTLEIREDATEAQRARLRALSAPADEERGAVRSSSGAARKPKRADARRVGLRPLLEVVAHVPDRAVVAGVDRGLGVVFPAQGVGLRARAVHQHGLAQR